jgi:tetratricopeptide (TPR) repeat protein
MVYFSKGKVLVKLERYDEAIEAFDLAIKYKPDFAKAYYNKGNTLSRYLNRYQEAIDAFDLAIKYDPDDVEAYYNKGLALKSLGRTAEAEAAFAKAKELDKAGN